MRITFRQSCNLRSLCLLSIAIFINSSVFATVHVSGTQSGTWTKANSPYILDGSVTVANGSTLNIQAGVTVIFSSASVSLSINGILNAQGVSADSIRFKGQADVNNHAYKYGGAVYISGSGSVMNYVSIDSLGDPNYVQSTISVYDTLTPTISNTSVKHSGSLDISCWAGGAKNLVNINGVININPGYVYYNATMPKVGGNTYYNLLGSVVINQGATLTINAGVKVIFPSASISLTINGKLNAQGTSADSIILKGKKDANNASYKYGGALYIDGSGSNMNYVSIDSLGDPNYVQSTISIYDTLAPVIKNTSIKHSGSLDIYSWIGGGKNMSNINGIFNVASGYIYYDAVMPKIGGNTYYNLLGSPVVNSGITLTMNSGITVVFPSASVSLTVNGILKAQGSSSDSIRLKGKADVNNSSYKYGGCIYIDGSGTTMNYVSLDSLGDPNYAQSSISIYDTLAPAITNTSVKHSGSLDIYSWIGGGKNMLNVNGIFNVAPGYVYYDATMPKIGGNTYYNLLGSLVINMGATVTMNSGINLKFLSASVSLTINGKLVAQGTATDSIRFQGQADISNSYKYGGGLYINGSGTVMNYVSLDSLGDSHYVQSVISIYDTLTPAITNTSIKHSGSLDIYSWAGGAKNMSNINGVFNVSPGYLYYNANMPKVGGNTYFNLTGSVTVSSGVTLTIQPGATVCFPSYYTDLDVNGKLDAQGTATDSISFKGKADPNYPTYKYGGYIYLNSSSTVMKYVSIDSLDDPNSGGPASVYIYPFDSTMMPTIANTSIKHSGVADIYTWAGGAKNMSNINGIINVAPGSIVGSATMPKINGSYYNLTGSVTVDAGKSLTIQPGVTLQFPSPYTDLTINGVLSARGNSNDTIRFKGTKDVVNNTLYGGSINLNVDGSNLSFISIDSMGGYNTGAVIASAGFAMKYATIRNSKNDGVSIYSPKAGISYTNITKNTTGVGVYYCKAVVNNCNIYSNTSYGVNNVSLTVMTDATQNYWGTTSGPYHPTLNKKGTGNKVSDSVNFSPYKTTIVLPILPYINTFSPASAATDTIIKITGLRFTGTTKVLFGNTAAKSFTVINDSTINATVGAGSSGYVKVTTTQGSDSLDGFTYCSGVALHADFAYGTSFYDINTFNTSIDATGYAWSFGDGATSTDQSPSHQYASVGSYTVCLTDTNVCAKRSETVCKIVVVNGITFTDDDKDGLYDLTETATYGTSTSNFDTNNDGLGDGPNVFTGYPPLSTDTDGDGISNLQELANGTNPLLADTDGDGVNDKSDPFPLDQYRSKLPATNSSDHTAPTIILSEPF